MKLCFKDVETRFYYLIKNITQTEEVVQAQVMSLGDVFKKFFGESDESKREKEEDEIIKSLSLAACENKHKILLECYKNSWVGGCRTEMENFWKCVNDHKAILKEKAKAYPHSNTQPRAEQTET